MRDWMPSRSVLLLAGGTFLVGGSSQCMARVEHGTFEGQVIWLLASLLVVGYAMLGAR